MPVSTRSRSSSTSRLPKSPAAVDGEASVATTEPTTPFAKWFKPIEGTVPIARRPRDIAFIGFFLLNLIVITYVVDIEQITAPVAPPNRDAICAKVSQLSPLDVSSSGSTIYGRWEGSYPVWPPRSAVDVIRWYGCSYDPPLMARPAWWRSTIWSDSLLFGPFYVVAIWAYWVGDKRIRIPTIIYASVIATNVFVIMFEEYYGVNHTASPTLVTLLNVPWFVIPLLALARMWAEEEPFATATSHTKNE